MGKSTNIILGAVLILLLGATLYFVWAAEPPAETKDRLSPEAMERMVQGPMATVRASGLEAGRASFDQMLAVEEVSHGARSVRVADLVTAFGVELYSEGLSTDNEEERRVARDYLRDAVPRYRAAFGPNNPEVAVALHTFADADVATHNNRLTPAAKAALEEALRIRRASLGADDRETKATEARLARLRNGESRPLSANSED